jgi:hypothetical protein
MKTKAWVRLHWKTDTKRHTKKRRSTGPVETVEKLPHGDSKRSKSTPQSTDVDRSVVFERPVGPELVSDFKKRIAAIKRFQDTGEVYSVIGGPRAHSCVVRRPKQ